MFMFPYKKKQRVGKMLQIGSWPYCNNPSKQQSEVQIVRILSGSPRDMKQKHIQSMYGF